MLWLKEHFEGGYLIRKLVVVEAFIQDASPAGWQIKYGMQSETPNDTSIVADARLDSGTLKFEIPIASPEGIRPGINGQLRFEVSKWV